MEAINATLSSLLLSDTPPDLLCRLERLGQECRLDRVGESVNSELGMRDRFGTGTSFGHGRAPEPLVTEEGNDDGWDAMP